MKMPHVGSRLPRFGNRFTRKTAAFLLTAAGWRIEGDIPNIAQAVVIAAPHTSNWDFVVGMLAIFAVGIRFYWLGKDSFVNGPLGGLLRAIGGIAVDRSAAHGIVPQIAAAFSQSDQFLLALAPEGTRKKVSRWRTGFYYIALAANVPILPVALDFGCKTIRIAPLFYPTGEVTAELPRIQSIYDHVEGHHPHQY